jgi:hypothetical protein
LTKFGCFRFWNSNGYYCGDEFYLCLVYLTTFSNPVVLYCCSRAAMRGRKWLCSNARYWYTCTCTGTVHACVKVGRRKLLAATGIVFQKRFVKRTWM